jgi:hypothetical protein
MRLHQAPDHRPVFVSLCFLGLYEVGQREQFALCPFGKGYRGAPSPKSGKGLHAAHFGHHIHPHPQRFGMLTTKMKSVTAFQILQFERRNGDEIRA